MTYTLTLDYTLPKGSLTPYFDGLAQGAALAEICADCARVQFPPGGICGNCDGTHLNWQPLPGTARIVQRTDTPDSAFALVQFDGARNAALVEIANPGAQGGRGTLTAPRGTAPGLLIELIPETGGTQDV